MLTKLSDVAIFRYYLGYDFKIKHMYLSPFRKEKSPSFNLFYNEGEINYKDFGHSSGDFLNFVQNLFSLDYRSALEKIYNDMILGSTIQEIQKLSDFKNEFKSKNTILQCEIKNFTESELNYWLLKYGITIDTLKKFDTFSGKFVWINKKLYWVASENNPIFCYYYPSASKVKCYAPNREKGKRFISNVTGDIIDGLDQLPKDGPLLIWTKARKDIMVYDTFGIPAVAPIGETVNIRQPLIDHLFSRFDNIICNYDPDDVGKFYSSKMVEKGLSEWFIPEGAGTKDISDFREKYGHDETKELLKIFKI